MKLIIASLIVFSLIILFLFALFPSDVSVTRVVQIGTSKAKLYRKIADLREWNWNEMVYDAFPSHYPTVYAGNRIDSNSIVLRNVTVTLVKAGEDSVFTRWQHGEKYFMGNFILSSPTSGQTVLQWTLHFHVKWYPWEKLASMFYDKQLGPLMDKSLGNLQKLLESP